MKRFIRFIFNSFLFIWLLGLAFYFLEMTQKNIWMQPSVNRFLHSEGFQQFLAFILMISSGLLSLLFIFVFFTSTKRHWLSYTQEHGTVKVSKSYVEKIVNEAYEMKLHPSRVKIKVKIKRRNKIIVRAKIYIRDAKNQQALIEEFRHNAQASLINVFEIKENKLRQKIKAKELSNYPSKDRKGKRVV